MRHKILNQTILFSTLSLSQYVPEIVGLIAANEMFNSFSKHSNYGNKKFCKFNDCFKPLFGFLCHGIDIIGMWSILRVPSVDTLLTIPRKRMFFFINDFGILLLSRNLVAFRSETKSSFAKYFEINIKLTKRMLLKAIPAPNKPNAPIDSYLLEIFISNYILFKFFTLFLPSIRRYDCRHNL